MTAQDPAHTVPAYLKLLTWSWKASTEANCVRSGASGASGLQAWLAAIFLKVSGQQINLSKVFTMLEKLGLWARSFCQQSSISWWIASGQSMGAGRR